MTDEERIAAFLAAKGVTKIAPAPAFGIDPVADALRRKEARAAKRREQDADDAEWRSEEYRERVNDAYMSGGSRARDEEMAIGPMVRRSRRIR